ncbi:hypothetical protein AX16_004540 [Volvariella volvacea WC 439]|nr:hypothetical protein AX16_004540 [Volvariella volvacea WC 439]
MGQFFDDIPEFLIPWIQKQHVFWVATAALSANGHVNVSPKGVEGVFHIVNSKRVWYEDLSGSGVETVSHIRENGRITILFNAFEGPPRICRLFGTGTVHEFGSPEYDSFLPPGKRQPGSRAVIIIDVHKVGTSCGYAVPYYEFQGHRSQLLYFFDRRENAEREVEGKLPSCDVTNEANSSFDPSTLPAKGMRRYWLDKNSKSIDGIPGLQYAFNTTKKFVSLSVPKRDSREQFDEEGRLKQGSSAPSSDALVATKVKSVVNVNNLVVFVLGLIVASLYHRYSRVLAEEIGLRCPM